MLGFTADEWSSDAAFWEERIHPEDRREGVGVERLG